MSQERNWTLDEHHDGHEGHERKSSAPEEQHTKRIRLAAERVFIMTNVDQSRPGLLHHLWKSALLSGLLAVVLGVLILVCPGKSIIVAAVFLGIYLVVSGRRFFCWPFGSVSGSCSVVLQRPSPLSVTPSCPDGAGRSSSALSRSS